MKKLLTSLAVAGLLMTSAAVADELKKVYINQIVEHPALDATAEGIVDGLEKRGFIKGENLDIRIESAQANVSLAAQISSKFVSNRADVTVGIGTPSAQSLVKAAREGETKMVFSSITDPIDAGLVSALEGSNNNVTGMSNYVEVKPQLEMFFEFVPKLERLGFIYNPADANSIVQLNDLQKAAKELNVQVVEQAVNRTADVPQAAARLAGRTDAIFIYGDNTALAALGSIVNAANKEKIPVFVADTDAVEVGPLAALGPNQYDLGLDTAEMIADILEGRDINTIPVGFPGKMELYINLDAAKRLDMNISDELLERAAKLISAEEE